MESKCRAKACRKKILSIGFNVNLTTMTASTDIIVSVIKCYCKAYCFTLRSESDPREGVRFWLGQGLFTAIMSWSILRRNQPPIQRVLYGGITMELSSRNVTLTIQLYTVQEVKTKPTVPKKCQGSTWRNVLPTFTFKGKGRPRTSHGDPENLYSTLPATWMLHRGRWSTSCSGRCTPEKRTRHLLCRRLGGPQGRSGRVRTFSFDLQL
jgi:hypothetical protein